MTWVTGILVFVMLWWLVFFAVLPWGVRPGVDHEAGQDAGAPVNPALARKAAVTPALAAILFALVYWAVAGGVFDSLIHR